MLEVHLRSALGAVVSLERELSETLRGTAESIRFPHAVATASARATALFEQIVLQYSDTSDGAEAASHIKVEELGRNYTMAHERAVHEAVIGISTEVDGNPAAEPGTLFENDDMLVAELEEEDPTPNTATGDEELADNVELF